MIKEFTVENSLSFDAPQTISFEATSDTTSDGQLIYKVVHPKTGLETRVLRMVALYGANAAGKTNLLLALKEVWNKLYYSFPTKDHNVKYTPFILRLGSPTKMAVEFFVAGVCYYYSIEFNGTIILHEKLEFNPEGRRSLFYERRYDDAKNIPIIEFGKNSGIDSKTAGVFCQHTLNNHTVLSTYGKITVEAPQVETLRNWIANFIYSIKDERDRFDIIFDMVENDDKKHFLLEAIQKADFNISNILAEKRELPDELIRKVHESRELDDDSKNTLLSKKIVKIEFEHHYKGGAFNLPIGLESEGTMTYIGLIEKLYNIIKSEKFVQIDEIEDSLHYDLLTYFLQMLLINEHRSQFIFTTHNQLILDEDFIRRDMVWFVDKNINTASSELFSAVDFGLHKNVSIYNAYKMGRLGAKPEVGTPFIG